MWFLIPFVVALFLVTPSAYLPVGTAHAAFLTDEDKARLQSEYDSIQGEIAEWQKVLDETRAKKASLQGDVTVLTALINKATAEIKQRNVTITKLADEISRTKDTLSALDERLNRGRASLSNMLRIENEVDRRSLAELVLSQDTFDDVFGDLNQIATVREDLRKLFDEIMATKSQVEAEQEALAARQSKELDARYEVEQSKKQIAASEAEKKKLLNVTKDQEKAYQTVLAERQRRAEQIQSALFPLRDVTGISFGTALDYASVASQATGVRASLILAILSQESDLGKNVGACYVSDLETGNGVGKNTGTAYQKVMKAPRDTAPFERITDGVGRLWGATPVSCPLGTVYTSSRGYGGAMGPSQFIPSTWELYEDRLRSALGIGSATPDPWNAAHAIMATALYLEDLGAAGGAYTAERNAACRYYSGRACDTKKPTNYTYGDSVIKKAEAFQGDIDFLKGIPPS